MITDLDLATEQKNYKNINQKIAKVEIELYKVRESANKLLSEIQEITISDEKYRSIVTKLKSKYRKLNSEFNDHKDDYEDVSEAIELQLETVEKRFLDFENSMEKNEYDEVSHIVKALDTMIDHLSMVIIEVPNLVLLATKLIPKRIEEINNTYKEMTSDGYNLDFLNLEFNMTECNKNVNLIFDRIKVLNLDDCMFDLKTILDYLDSIFNDFENEKIAKKEFDNLIIEFTPSLKKTNHIVKDIYKQIDDLKNLYDLSDSDIDKLNNVKLEVASVSKDYKKLVESANNHSEAFSGIYKKCEALFALLHEVDGRLDESLKSLGSMHDDELRAREQLEEISDLLKQCKIRIRSYKLPIIVNNYFVELSEANDAIIEIEKELRRKPIVIKVLNTRVDTARDLVLKLYNTTNDMLKTAQMAEMAIVYGNRYRSLSKEVDRGLENAEMLFLKGSYKDALDLSISSIKIVDNDITSKINNIINE